MASIMKRGNTYSVRYNYKDHAGKPCKGWETFKTKAEAQERKITVEKELLDGTFLVPDTMTVEEMLYNAEWEERVDGEELELSCFQSIGDGVCGLLSVPSGLFKS